jgi:hypothetical protein
VLLSRFFHKKPRPWHFWIILDRKPGELTRGGKKNVVCGEKRGKREVK